MMSMTFGLNQADFGSLGGNEEYIVQKGDTLFTIAQRFYGDGNKYKMIATDNNIANPNVITVGMKLYLFNTTTASAPVNMFNYSTPSSPLPGGVVDYTGGKLTLTPSTAIPYSSPTYLPSALPNYPTLIKPYVPSPAPSPTSVLPPRSYVPNLNPDLFKPISPYTPPAPPAPQAEEKPGMDFKQIGILAGVTVGVILLGLVIAKATSGKPAAAAAV